MLNEAKLKWKVVDEILNLTSTIEGLQDEHHLLGVKEHVNTCINKLKKMSGTTTCFLGLVGMGGVGKTTLAKEIYDHLVCQKKFQAMTFLEIRRSLTLSSLQEQLLCDLMHVSANNRKSYAYWFRRISNQGPVLVLLDDIYEKDIFHDLILDTKSFAPGSCIIVTSRDRHLLRYIGKESNFYLHEVTPLSCDDSQRLFNFHDFGIEKAPENFKVIADDVSKACGGLPLALKVVGSSLFDKRSHEDQECIWPEAIKTLNGNHDVMKALKWSYDCLSKLEKMMFVDIANVFYGWKKREALEIWRSCTNCPSCCGSESTPHTSLRHLIDKSLVVLEYSKGDDYVLSMHSLLRELGKNIGTSDGSHLWKAHAAKAVDDKILGSNNVRALNLVNSGKTKFESENFAKMTNLHFLIVDGCNVSGDFGNISKELRFLQWRNMPLIHIPPSIKFLFNLISLDFSQSTKLARIWTESDPALEACPNLLKLDLSKCTSITVLPNSTGRLSRLQVLNLDGCEKLQNLPSSIGQLSALQQLRLRGCRSLEALPDTITALFGLQLLFMHSCSSIAKLPSTMGLMTSLMDLYIDLTIEWQAIGIGQLSALKRLMVRHCTNEAITMLDSSSSFKNLNQLSIFSFVECTSMVKLPKTIELLTNLDILDLFECDKLQDLPNSIVHLKLLTRLYLRRCNNLETLPKSLDELISLQWLWIMECTSITKLPLSIGYLSKLQGLRIEGCNDLQPLPDSLMQLKTLEDLTIMDCGSLKDLDVLKVLQGLRIWGCTSITELPGSCLTMVEYNFNEFAWYFDIRDYTPVLLNLKELKMVEANDCGFLQHVQSIETGQFILQRIYKSPCCKLTKI